jgi:hypothetical protein
MAVTAAVSSAVVGAYGVSEQRKENKRARADREKAEAKTRANQKKSNDEKIQAKIQEYKNTRAMLGRSARRGRLSTVGDGGPSAKRSTIG